MWGFGAGAKIIEKIGKIVFQVMNSVESPFSSTSIFFSLHFSNGRSEKEPQTSTGQTPPKLILLPKLSTLKTIRTKLNIIHF